MERYGRVNVTVSVVNFKRGRLYGTKTNSGDNQGMTFRFLEGHSSQRLRELFYELKSGDRIIIGYELFKTDIDGCYSKVIRSIMTDF
jgi:hypothetical protein